MVERREWILLHGDLWQNGEFELSLFLTSLLPRFAQVAGKTTPETKASAPGKT